MLVDDDVSVSEAEPLPAASKDVGARTAIGAGWLIAWRMITRSLGMVSTLVLARILVPADFGLIAIATSFSAAVEALSEIGLEDALVRRHDGETSAYDTAFTMQLLRGLGTAAIVAAGARAASTWFCEPRLVTVVLVLAVLAAASGAENIGIVEFRRTLRFDVEFRLQLFPRLAQFVVTVAAAWLLRSYWALLIGIAVSKLARLAMTYVLHPYRPRLTLCCWRELVGFSFWTWASTIALLAWERSDAFILGPVLGPSGLGVYMIAIELAVLPISELVAPASRALFAGFSIMRNQGTDIVGRALPVITSLLTVVLPLVIAVSATAGQIVGVLLDPKWYGAWPLVSIFAWLCLFSTCSYVSSSVLLSTGAVRRQFAANAAAALAKGAVIYAASLTRSMEVVAIAIVSCVGIESVLFLRQLRALGCLYAAAAAGAVARMSAAAAITVAMLYFSGLGWRPPLGSGFDSLLYGVPLGVVAIATCIIAQFAIWMAFGRPSGAETRIVSYVGRLVVASAGRLSGRAWLTGGSAVEAGAAGTWHPVPAPGAAASPSALPQA